MKQTGHRRKNTTPTVKRGAGSIVRRLNQSPNLNLIPKKPCGMTWRGPCTSGRWNKMAQLRRLKSVDSKQSVSQDVFTLIQPCIFFFLSFFFLSSLKHFNLFFKWILLKLPSHLKGGNGGSDKIHVGVIFLFYFTFQKNCDLNRSA